MAQAYCRRSPPICEPQVVGGSERVQKRVQKSVQKRAQLASRIVTFRTFPRPRGRGKPDQSLSEATSYITVLEDRNIEFLEKLDITEPSRSIGV